MGILQSKPCPEQLSAGPTGSGSAQEALSPATTCLGSVGDNKGLTQPGYDESGSQVSESTSLPVPVTRGSSSSAKINPERLRLMEQDRSDFDEYEAWNITSFREYCEAQEASSVPFESPPTATRYPPTSAVFMQFQQRYSQETLPPSAEAYVDILKEARDVASRQFPTLSPRGLRLAAERAQILTALESKAAKVMPEDASLGHSLVAIRNKCINNRDRATQLLVNRLIMIRRRVVAVRDTESRLRGMQDDSRAGLLSELAGASMLSRQFERNLQGVTDSITRKAGVEALLLLNQTIKRRAQMIGLSPRQIESTFRHFMKSKAFQEPEVSMPRTPQLSTRGLARRIKQPAEPLGARHPVNPVSSRGSDLIHHGGQRQNRQVQTEHDYDMNEMREEQRLLGPDPHVSIGDQY